MFPREDRTWSLFGRLLERKRAIMKVIDDGWMGKRERERERERERVKRLRKLYHGSCLRPDQISNSRAKIWYAASLRLEMRLAL